MNSTPVTYQIIDHTADLGIIVKGPDVESLFILAAQAMTDLMVKGDISKKIATRDVLIEGEDFPDLMVR
ncbi:MAG: archease, partial [Thermoplasmata archaeon]